MIFVREASAADILVTLTLSLQCAGMAAVIAWARPSVASHVLALGMIYLQDNPLLKMPLKPDCPSL
jgi:hypothetical protein